MKTYISNSELCHRLCNGFISHDGYVDGKWRDLFAENGISYTELQDKNSPYGKLMDLVIQIIESIPEVEIEDI